MLIFMKVLLVLLITSLNLACVSSHVSDTSPVIDLQKESRVDYPFWIENPHLEGFIGITASAGMQKLGGVEGQRRVALLKAKAEYSRMLKSSIQSSTRITIDSGGITDAQDRRKISSGTAFNFGQAFVKDEWIHPKSKELNIWVLVPMGSLKN